MELDTQDAECSGGLTCGLRQKLTEFTGNAILQWTDLVKVEWHYIASGESIQNAFIES